jgi:hypothetical protein
VRAKEQQAGRKLGQAHASLGSVRIAGSSRLLSPASSPEGSPRAFSSGSVHAAVSSTAESLPRGSTGDALQRRGRNSGTGGRIPTASSEGRQVGGDDASDSDGLRGPPAPPPAGQSSRSAGVGAHPQNYYMSPDIRSWILHRNALATGMTGVEDVTAAAVQAAQEAPADGGDASTSRARLADAGSVATGSNSSSGLTYSVSPDRVVDIRSMGGALFDLVSVVQHSGSLGGGHYIAHAKLRDSPSWYTFDDAYVNEISASSVANKEAYILFYVRRRTAKFTPVPLPARDEASPIVYVSRAWWLRYCTLSVPGPISCADILCDHGRVKRQLAETIRQLTVALSLNQYLALAAAYGAAEPPLRVVRACHDCKVEAVALSDRRHLENHNIQQIDTNSLQADQVGGTGGDMRRVLL